MQTVTRLSKRCVLLDQGRIKLDGPARQVANAYLNGDAGSSALREWPDATKAPGDDVVRVRAVRVRSEAGELAETVEIDQRVGIDIEYDVLKPGYIFHPHFGLRNEDGVLLFIAQDVDPAWRGVRRMPGRYASTGWIPGHFLSEGGMSVIAALMTLSPEEPRAVVPDAVMFRVVNARDANGAGDQTAASGVVRPRLKWTTAYTPAAEGQLA
jgi:lipopolysaccharide transport system ATP-binding protein